MDKSTNAGRVVIVDPHGRSTIFFGSDSQTGLGTAGVIDGSALAKDLESSQFGVSKKRTPDYFHIIPEVDPDAVVGDNRLIQLNTVGSDAPSGQGIVDKAALEAYSSPTPPGTAALWTIDTN